MFIRSKFLFFILCLTFSFLGHARMLHIIHTNDLHSYFQGYQDGRGGYARLKARIDELRKESADQGIEVLQLDGGDFGEGTAFFLSDQGSASIKALEMLGAEISVVGNHDHMMGGNILGQQIRKAGVKTKILSANLIQTPDMELGDLIKPYADITKNGIKIRVIGLSTAELHFQYPLFPGFILPPTAVGADQANIARKAGRELVIALTHIGFDADVKLAQGSTEIDLIVGAHSHTRLDEVEYAKNKNGKAIPIVQASAHGLVVGSLMIDLKDDGSLEVVSYKLHEISNPMNEDSEMVNFVAHATEERNQFFDNRWDEVIGETLIPLSGTKNGTQLIEQSCWGEHMAKMTQEAVVADLGVHIAHFEGTYLAPGPITYGNMVDNYPHFSKYGDKGWQISTITVKGSVLKILLRALINLRPLLGVNFHGVTYQAIRLPKFIPYIGGRIWSFSHKINGSKILNDNNYRVAFPAEVGHAVKAALPSASQKVFPALDFSTNYYWDVMEKYIRANSPIKCL